jgi:hypothetical protein
MLGRTRAVKRGFIFDSPFRSQYFADLLEASMNSGGGSPKIATI